MTNAGEERRHLEIQAGAPSRRVAQELAPLHFDSILLFENGSYSTAFQLAVLSLEEFAKATRIEDYVWTSETNDGYPDAAFEQRWLQPLYSHTEKQCAFIRRFIFEYSPKFAKLAQARGLEEKNSALYTSASLASAAASTFEVAFRHQAE